jgi:hypothetical protein
MVYPVAAPRRVALGAALFIVLIALAAGGKAVLFDTIDPDCFLHLLAADQLLADGIGPLVDRQSFASVSGPWTPYSWLAELGMKWVWDHGGFRAAVVAHAAMSASIMGLIAGGCLVRARTPEEQVDGEATRRRGPAYEPPVVSRLSAVVATALSAFLAMPYLSFRPVTAAVLLLGVATVLIVRDRRMGERSAAVWWVIPLTVLMVNVHLFACAVPLYVGAMFLGAVWERRGALEPPDWPEGDRRVRRNLLLLVGTALACLCTPMIDGFPAALMHLQYDPIVTGPTIAEYQPFYRGGLGVCAAFIISALVISAYLSRRLLRVGEVIWLLVSFAMLLRMGRFAPVFAVGAAPVFAATLAGLSERILGRPMIAALAAVVLAAGAWRIGKALPTRQHTLDQWVNRHGPDAPGYPTDAAAYVEANVRPQAGRLINEYTWGGYLEWRLRDRFQMLVDGRTQCFSGEFWRLTYLGGEEARRDFFSRIRADAAILPARRSTFREALTELGWTSVYADGRAEVLLPPATAAQGPADPAARTAAGAELDWAWPAGLFGRE